MLYPASDLADIWETDTLFDAYIDEEKLTACLASNSRQTLIELDTAEIVRQKPTAEGPIYDWENDDPSRWEKDEEPPKWGKLDLIEDWQDGLSRNRLWFLNALLRAIERFQADAQEIRTAKRNIRPRPAYIRETERIILQLAAEDATQLEMCKRLGKRKRPPNTAWRDLPWNEAYMHDRYGPNVRTWLSKTLKRLRA